MEIKDLGSLRFFQGIKVTRNNAGISVYGRKFILDLLKEHGMAGCKAIDTPLGSNLNWDILRAVSNPVE